MNLLLTLHQGTSCVFSTPMQCYIQFNCTGHMLIHASNHSQRVHFLITVILNLFTSLSRDLRTRVHASNFTMWYVDTHNTKISHQLGLFFIHSFILSRPWSYNDPGQAYANVDTRVSGFFFLFFFFIFSFCCIFFFLHFYFSSPDRKYTHRKDVMVSLTMS